MSSAIYRGPKTGYVLTYEDMLWFARALGGETWGGADREDAQWHFWCWMDRFHLVRGNWQGPTGVPLEGQFGKTLVQWHSTATSPRWASADTAKCLARPKQCTAAMLANRAKWTHATEEQLIAWGVWKYAVEAAEGTLERPTSDALYDFASCETTAGQGRPCPGTPFGGQCFLKLECMKSDEIANLVRNDDSTLPGAVTLGVTPQTIGKTAVGILFGVAVLWAAWTLFSKKKG